MNNVNQNANAQIAGNALQAFKARFNLQERVRKSATKNVLPLNSLENGCQHLLNRVEAIRANSTSDEFKNTNLISLEDGIYTTSLYLGKAVIYLDGEQLNGEFDNAEEAVSMIEDYVALVKSGEEQFVQSMTKALAKISTYSIKDRSTKGHK